MHFILAYRIHIGLETCMGEVKGVPEGRDITNESLTPDFSSILLGHRMSCGSYVLDHQSPRYPFFFVTNQTGILGVSLFMISSYCLRPLCGHGRDMYTQTLVSGCDQLLRPPHILPARSRLGRFGVSPAKDQRS
jgi:hypothetical protein